MHQVDLIRVPVKMDTLEIHESIALVRQACIGRLSVLVLASYQTKNDEYIRASFYKISNGLEISSWMTAVPTKSADVPPLILVCIDTVLVLHGYFLSFFFKLLWHHLEGVDNNHFFRRSRNLQSSAHHFHHKKIQIERSRIPSILFKRIFFVSILRDIARI
jgi:hypothetical protein